MVNNSYKLVNMATCCGDINYDMLKGDISYIDTENGD